MKTFLRLLLVASVLYGTGAHWAALQGIALAKMAIDGREAPCDLCQLVERGSAASSTPVVAAAPALDFAVPAPPAFEAVPAASRPPVSSVPAFVSLSAPPPVPPPPSVLPA